jgi:acetyl esterase/lipase
MIRSRRFLPLLFLAALPALAQNKLPDTAAWAATMTNSYIVQPNITYLTANNFENRVDVYRPRNAVSATPVLLYIHGGGWVGGSKESAFLQTMPYLEMGWAVVNVQYRLARISLAPAAVEDCRCALLWVIRNAKQYNFDVDRIVVTGHSAGGHLALTTGMLPADAGLERQCPGTEELKVAAIVNWYGITDVVDLLDGPNMKSYAVTWLSSMTNREEIARRVSPLKYVRKGLPPILTIHGDTDPTVPYNHGVQLHQALDKAGVPNKLHTVKNGKHGGFTQEETLETYGVIRDFLAAHKIR